MDFKYLYMYLRLKYQVLVLVTKYLLPFAGSRAYDAWFKKILFDLLIVWS